MGERCMVEGAMREVQGRSCQEGDAWWQVPGDGCGVEGPRRCRMEDAWRVWVPGSWEGSGIEVQGGSCQEGGAWLKIPGKRCEEEGA
jgi:hypothetical protein